jgi:hypothetical protein
MDTLILLVVIVVVGAVVLKKYKPDTYNSLKDKVLSLVKRK